jgi:RNA polymerase sigma-70 factor (ECF subfamily)
LGSLVPKLLLGSEGLSRSAGVERERSLDPSRAGRRGRPLSGAAAKIAYHGRSHSPTAGDDAVEPTALNERLSHIPTLWTLVCRANDGTVHSAGAARGQILQRYGGAVRRYLLGAVRDADAADELFQDFALRFLHGGLRGADPERGRFRDFVKGVLGHLVADHFNRLRRRPVGLPAGVPEPAVEAAPDADLDRAFVENWRDELLARAWAALEAFESQSGQPFFTVLRFRADHPELRSPELAQQLGDLRGKPLTAANVRQLLHRAREKFAGLLLDDVADSLNGPTADDLEEELRELGLLDYCRPALERRASQGAA